MALSPQQSLVIKEYLIQKIRGKLAKYNPETSMMPFHHRLLGKDRTATFSFVHSVNTMLGQSIFEQVGKIIVEDKALQAIAQCKDFEGYISSEAVLEIDGILRELNEGARQPDKKRETAEVLKVATKGNLGKKLKKRVDLFVQLQDKTECYFEIKTAKPNIEEFIGVKRKLLNWIAMRGAHDPKIPIRTIVAIPYNPYEPKSYNRWTLQGLIDLSEEMLVGKEFWDFLGGENTFEDLLKIFEEAGLELYDDIEKKMMSLKTK